MDQIEVTLVESLDFLHAAQAILRRHSGCREKNVAAHGQFRDDGIIFGRFRRRHVRF